MCLICCFNLVEAYINGIAWGYVQENDISDLSGSKRKLLQGQASILDKLTKVPQLVTNAKSAPLSTDKSPLREFRDVIKPYRDSIVHASPFAAPQQFGGYNKLNKIYILETGTVRAAVDTTLGVIGEIHQFLGSGDVDDLPEWIPGRNEDGTFQIQY
jgi:hypothetical protein